MTHDPTIIEAAARALHNGNDLLDPEECSEIVRRILAAVSPLIRAAALEEAAQAMDAEESYLMPDEAARAIRALKEQP
jgi:hypothetical protein